VRDPVGPRPEPAVTPEATVGARAVADARDLLGTEDGHLSARLDDAERATTLAQSTTWPPGWLGP
jgi:hypothetical protein